MCKQCNSENKSMEVAAVNYKTVCEKIGKDVQLTSKNGYVLKCFCYDVTTEGEYVQTQYLRGYFYDEGLVCLFPLAAIASIEEIVPFPSNKMMA